MLASTHEPEEEGILSRCGPLWRRFPGLQLLIAPRHPARAQAVADAAARYGRQAILRSHLTGQDLTIPPEVIVLDTIGELTDLLALADLVFVGGSLAVKGGHNPIEPAIHGRAILMGPNYFHFTEIVNAFVREQALLVVGDAVDLVARAESLLADNAGRVALGARAAAVVRRHGGASRAWAEVLEAVVVDAEWIPSLLLFDDSEDQAKSRPAA